MANVTYDKQLTALLEIDPYNDFISDGGKVWDRLRALYQHLNHEPQTGRKQLTRKSLQRQDLF
jgi:hypothetical protein